MYATEIRPAVMAILGVLFSAGTIWADETPRFDRHGDPLPPGAMARMGTIRLRTGNHTNSIAWTPDGKYFATGGEARFVQIWDPATGKEVYRVPTVATRAHCVRFSPDGKWLAVAGDHSDINLWDATLFGDQAKPRQLSGSTSTRGIAFAPDSKILFSCVAGDIQVWDVAAGRELRRFGPGKGYWLDCIALSRDGQLLVSRERSRGGDGNQISAATLWNAVTGDQIRQFGKPGHTGRNAATFATDGRTLAVVGDEEVKIWNVQTGAETAAINIRTESAAFAPDGKSLYTVDKGHLRQWAIPSGKLLRSFKKKQGLNDYSLVALSPDGKTIVTSHPVVALWDVDTGTPRPELPGHDTTIWSVLFVNGGKELLSAGFDSPVYRWDLEGRLLDEWKRTGGGSVYWPTAVLSPDGKTLAMNANRDRAILIDPLTGAERQIFDGHQTKTLLDPNAHLRFAFSPDGRRVVSAGNAVDRHVRMWDTETAKELWSVTTDPPKTSQHSLALSPDGKSMFVTTDGPVKVYEIGKAGVQRQIGEAKLVVRNLCLTRDGRRLAGVEKNATYIWDAATGLEVCRVPRERPGEWYDMIFLKFSPDGRTLAIWDRDVPTVRCLEIASGQVRLITTGHLEMVLAADFSADGRRLVTGGTDTTVLLWDLDALAIAGDTAKTSDINTIEIDLASLDARIAYRAIVRLRRLGPKAVTLLAERLKPVHHRPLAACIADLDDERFAVRERAFEELLSRPGDKDALAKSLAATNPLEVRRRLQRILDSFGDYDSRKDARRLYALRGLEVLEGVDTAQAKRIVEALARGSRDAELTVEAIAALKRMR